MTMAINNRYPFMKMHGLGNDFVVIDARGKGNSPPVELIAAMADRRRGIGFDQLAIISGVPSELKLAFYNHDGSTSATCGNATRCIARYLMDEKGKKEIELNTPQGKLAAREAGEQLTAVNMGKPLFDWRDVPLSHCVDTLHLPLEGDPVAVSFGNPHCTFFVEDIDAVEIETLGPHIECHDLFPQRTNVQVAQIINRTEVRARVWERGVGMTLASGSSACAVTVAAERRGLTDQKVRVELDGGPLWVEWADDGVWQIGQTAYVFDGELTPQFIASWS